MAKITRAHKVCDQQLHVLQERVAELEAKLAALDWTPITESNLPKVGDTARRTEEVTVFGDSWDFSDWMEHKFVDFRPINPPVQP